MIFNKKFGEEESPGISKEFLISGLFTALSQLVQETLKDRLKELVLQNRKIFFTFRKLYFIVLVTSYDIDSKIAKKILHEIDENFANLYNLEDFQGRTDVFHDFEPIVEKIIDKNKTRQMKLMEKYQTIIQPEVNKFSIIKTGGNALG
jgi:hypothetical protein